MSIWKSKKRNLNLAFHASALLGCVCFMTYDDQAIQMVFFFSLYAITFSRCHEDKQKTAFC